MTPAAQIGKQPPACARDLNTAVFSGLVVAALATALAFRVAALDLRPMHHDEANQAVKFGLLLETGEYRYDRNDHHGPTLYYLTLPSAWIRGQATLAALDEWTLRLVPAVFGAGLILLLPLTARGLGRTGVAASALVAAVSPALTYYSRFYIQETLFAFFVLGFLIAVGRSIQWRRAGWAAAAGIFAGLAYSTKETSLIVLLAAGVAAWLAGAWTRAVVGKATSPFRASTAGTGNASAGASTEGVTGMADAAPSGEPSGASASAARAGVAHLALGIASAMLVAIVLYSSFLSHPLGILESFRAFAIYARRGIDPGLHAHPWHYYLDLLAYCSSGGLVWTEALVLLLALIGLIAACRKTAGFWPRYLGLYTLITTAVFSAVRYKTPWNLLPFYVGVMLMAGYGASVLIHTARHRVARVLLVTALLVAASHLGLQCWRASFRYAADPRNPYAYAQTTPDFLRLVRRVSDLAAIHPERTAMFVKVIAGPYEQWPLPWYLRRMTRVGYWVRPADAATPAEAPVIIASQEHVEPLEAVLGDRYVSEFYGLRPDVVLAVFIEKPLWNRLLASRQ